MDEKCGPGPVAAGFFEASSNNGNIIYGKMMG